MSNPKPSVLAIHPVLEGFQLNPRAGGKDLAAGVCTDVLLEMGCEVSVWPLNWSGEEATERIFSKHEIFWGKSGRIQIVPTCYLPRLFAIIRILIKELRCNPLRPRFALRRAMTDAFCQPLSRISPVLREVSPSLLHVHQTQNPLVKLVKAKAPQTKAVLSNHSGVISSFVEDYDSIILPSEWMKNAILKDYPHLEPRVQVIPYFLQPEHLSGDEEVVSREGIIFIGLLNDNRKGLDILINALIHLAKSGVRVPLQVVGEGTLKPQYEKMAREANLEVTFNGKLTTLENIALLRKAKIFCMPSREENFPIVYIEALASGTPIIGYPPAVNELKQILHEEIGASYEANKSDPAELAELIRSWMQEKCDKFAEGRSEVKKRTRAHFSISAYRQAYRELYEKLLG